ncbi:MAG: ABC transporter ATP-binding protein [Acetobacteraceae bacterium]
MAKVALRGIDKAFGAAAVLRDVSLEIGDGELVSLLGPSGCGKTTLLRILAGFETPDRGAVSIDGEEITRLPPARRNMGMVFQAYSLFPNMTAEENVAFGLRVRGRDHDARARRADELLEMVGLTQHREKYPRQLSGGQQQRVALARALAVAPQVLLLDEPLSALDAKVRVQLREEIRRIQRQTRISTVFVTHDQEEALSISDRVAVMNAGRLVQVGAPAEIYREPTEGFVASFIGSAAVLGGTAEAGGVRVGVLLLQAAAAARYPAGAEVDLFLRPEHVEIHNGATPDGAIAAEVVDRTFFGSLTRVRLALADEGAVIWADLPSLAAEALAPGRRVKVTWPADAPRVLGRPSGEGLPAVADEPD